MSRRRRIYTLACLIAGFSSRIIWHSLMKLHTGWFIGSHRPKKPCLKFGNRGEGRRSWLRHSATVWDVPGSNPSRDVNNFQVTYSFCPRSVALESTQKFVGKVRPAPGDDNSAVLLERNVEVRMEVQNFISPLSLHDLLGENVLKYNNHNDLLRSDVLARISQVSC